MPNISLTRYLLRRLAFSAVVLFGATLITFVLSNVMPGDPAALLAGPDPSPERIAAMRELWHLNDPLYVRYFLYIVNFMHGNLGTSLVTTRPIIEDLVLYFPATFELATFAAILSITIGIALGVLAAANEGGTGDHVARFLMMLGISIPLFWTGLILVLGFYGTNGYWGLLGLGGRIDPLMNPSRTVTGFYLVDGILAGDWPGFVSSLKHIVLPASTLAIYTMGRVARMTRSNMLDVKRQDYVKFAESRGLPTRVITFTYLLRNAFLPIITSAAFVYGTMLGGSIIVETIFSWPGLGLYLYDSILSLDYPGILGGAVLLVTVFVVLNLATDLLYALLDPRVKYQ